MMNILILSWRAPRHPNAGGAEVSTYEHAKGWVKDGHQVIWFTSAFVGGKQEEMMEGVRIIRQGRQILGVQWEAFKWCLFSNHPKFDLVVDQFHGIPFFTPIYVRSKKLAFIHEVTKEVWRLNPWQWPFNKIAAFIGEIFEPVVFRLYKKIPFMTVSNSTKEDLISWRIPREHISIIYNGVNIPNLKKIPTKRGKILIFLGALSKDKGIEDGLKVFQLIDQTLRDKWHFWVVGAADPRYLKFLRLRAQRLGISNKVKFWGFVNEKKKFDLLAKAYLAINPSIREGWSLVVIEAASVGTPTIGYNVPGLRDSIIDNKTGLLSEPKPEELAKKIINVLEKDKLYRQFQIQCLMWSSKFTWKKSLISSTKLIKDIVKYG